MNAPALPPLPEPTSGLGSHRWAYGPEDMRAYARTHGQQCRDEALEAAARQCDDMVKAAHAVNHPAYADIPLALALAIRALKTTPP